MRIIISIFLGVFCFFSMSGQLCAAPEIKVIPSRSSIQKGTIFEIRLEIAAREALSKIVITPLVPMGFTLHSSPSQGVEVEKDSDVVRISHINAGSSIAVLFTGASPPVIGQSKVSTSEAKTFGFNFSYVQDTADTKGPSTQFISTTIQYTTHISLYLIAGILGTILGHLIKTGIKKREDLSRIMQVRGGVKGTSDAIRDLFGTNLSGLITILIIGFGALLVLAKDGIPVAGWHQAMTLGIGLAVLTDDQLLSKFNGKNVL